MRRADLSDRLEREFLTARSSSAFFEPSATRRRIFLLKYVRQMAKLMAQPHPLALLPKEKFASYEFPTRWLPRRSSIHLDWITCCKTGKQAACHFGYAGPMTEAVLLGNVAMRAQGPIEWDSASMKVTNNREAERYVRREYRKGWTL